MGRKGPDLLSLTKLHSEFEKIKRNHMKRMVGEFDRI